MYATEMSTGPMKEIEHVSKPENRNPFFLFPVTFSLMIVALVIVLGIAWIRIGFYWKVGGWRGGLGVERGYYEDDC